ncbi:AGE family epimerase/isomerase [Clostridium sp. YIM B02505]|uniref:AGE family epimerase/isomerase n=1 Tax=Clostridium yunnanense TaxID=2800325 RepID=A0ABS1EVG7_9CLOT|nr:AGE family epimerase/isomerase [Clostridium yunnanense]MBK1813376.1 AGE family epimerase/isomerase [Clostridium yunnanense]
MVNNSACSSDFENPEWLKKHIFQILDFYYPKCMDYENGGYFSCFLEDGTIGDLEIKHLLGTAKFIYIFSIGALLDNDASWCIEAVEHGLKFLQEFHLDKKNGGYYWTLKGQQVLDSTKSTTGHALVLLAASKAYEAGVNYAKDIIEYVYELLEKYFWEPQHELYVSDTNSDFSIISPYRSQKANMHMCEAMIAAYEATSDKKFLKKCYELSKSVTVKLASKSGGMIWDHYDENWQVDWDYGKESTDDIRTEAFIPGYSIQWSRLLLMLKRNFPQEWMSQKAEYLYNTTMSKAVDNEYGGIFYSISKKGLPIDTDKYFWVVAETLGASALLASDSKEAYYWNVYTYISTYCETFFIDKEHGGWYEKLNRTNEKYNDLKALIPKVNYHPVSNCYEVIKALMDY